MNRTIGRNTWWHGLATRAPVCDADALALHVAANGFAAASTWLVFSAINPEVFTGIGRMGRAPLSAVLCEYAVPGIFKHIGLDQPADCGNKRGYLLGSESRYFAERIDADDETNL